MLETIWHDLRYGARLLRKSPGFTCVAIATLALGIGANTVIFSVVNAVILRPLPFPNPQQLVVVWESDYNRNVPRGTAPPADFLDWRSQNHVFQYMSAMQILSFDLTGAGVPQQLWGIRVSPDFFDMLGVKPALGRTFLPEEEQPGRDRSVILSHELWASLFASSPDVIGKSITISENPFTVVGVLPAGFNLFGRSTRYDLWMPLSFSPEVIRRDNPSLIVFARMKPGITIAQASADMNTITSRLASEYPKTNQGVGSLVGSMHYELARSPREPLLIILGAVGLVLLIACANVASLLLSRAAVRRREVSIRAAMGAKRSRLVRQMLTESILLGVAGGAAGLLLAYGGLKILPAVLPPAGALGELPHVNWIGLNWTVLVFTVAIALLTGIIFGLVPAFQSSRPDLNESLKEGGRSTSGGVESRLARNSLVVFEVGISLVLLVGAVTLIRGFRELLDTKPGFNPRNVLSMQVWLPYARYPDPALARSLFQQVIERMRSLPGVESASSVNFLPLSGWTDITNLDIEGRTPTSARAQFNAQYRVIDSRYFHTMQMPVLKGRAFSDADGEQAPLVAVINQTMARDYWSRNDPIGQRIRIHLQASQNVPWRATGSDNWITIVGVVGDIQNREWGNDTVREVYLPYLQEPSRLMSLVLRTRVPPLSLAQSVREIVADQDKQQPVTSVKTMEELLSDTTSPQALDSTLLGFFAALALILAAIGIYGVNSYSVEQRTHEIGIRMALGAQPRDILRLVIGQGLGIAIIGAGFGIIVAYAVTRLLANSFFGIHAVDPTAASAAVLVLLLVAAVACYIPASRAAAVDPLQALRCE
ncbi:MAG TPA: ABC transporter permease [Candidatus Acidoferrales bacterium]|nr:ABC transporter permease [Candidatus Acidoferrales bacterium]